MTTRRLRQCTELEYILLGDLRDLLEESADEETAHWLEVVLDALLDTLPEEFALKSDQVAKLEAGYSQLFNRLTQLRDRLNYGGDFQRIAVTVSSDLTAWMNSFIEHHQEERELVSMAANYEVGGDG